MEISNNELIKTNYSFFIGENCNLVLSLKSVKEAVSLTFSDNIECNIKIVDFDENNNVTFFVNRSSHINVHIINDSKEKRFFIHGNVNEDSALNFYFADLAPKNTVFESNIILFGESATSKFNFCSVATKGVIKKYNIGFDHLGIKTNSLLEGYGVSLNDGEIDVKGISHIEKDSIKSIVNQKVKVILFDEESKAKASPILKIDCDDIIANHACAIGSLNEDHIFYLKSRGLSEDEARKLVTMGYLIPIENYFDENGKEIINNYIKENF